jgi:hypothetical protein
MTFTCLSVLSTWRRGGGQKGDLFCDASRIKPGKERFIAYKKAFIYVIRKVNGKWTLIGIGG